MQPSEPPSRETAPLKDRAAAHLRLGDLTEAERCYRLLLSAHPKEHEALVPLGFILRESGRLAEATDVINHALAIAPNDADAHYLRGTLYRAESNLTRAICHFELAATLKPDFEFAYRDLIVALFQAHRPQDAICWCDRALQQLPNSGELHFYRSNLLSQANAIPAAIASVRMALRLRPGLISARSSLASLLLRAERGPLPERSGPEYVPAHDIAASYSDLGIAYLSSEDLDGALDAFDRAAALAPDILEHQYFLGAALKYQQELERAEKCFEKAISLNPSDVRPRLAKALLYAAPFPPSSASASQARAHTLDALEDLRRWCNFQNFTGNFFDGLSSPFYLSYQEQDNRAIFEKYGALCATMAGTRRDRGTPTRPAVVRSSTCPLRIGIVSADIREHSVWFALTKGWLQQIDRKRFQLAVFSLSSHVDNETEWAKAHSDYFISGPKSIQDWENNITSLSCNALIYPALGLDAVTLQLASRRLAPTQITTWGHPETSGLPTIDLYLSGEDFEPPNAQNYYSETLCLLPQLGSYFQRRVQHVVEPDLIALGIDPDRPILICSGTPFKYQLEHDWLLAEIAKSIDGAQLIFFRQRPEKLSDILRSRLERTFRQAGIRFERHVRFIPIQPLPAYHGLLRRATLALDSIGFSGYSTAIQALESGLPLVTLEGRFLRGRLASGILRRLGVTELIVKTAEEYVRLCAELVRDSGRIASIRYEVNQRGGSLYGNLASIRHLEHVIENAAAGCQ